MGGDGDGGEREGQEGRGGEFWDGDESGGLGEARISVGGGRDVHEFFRTDDTDA
jgi:hypothetical protein